MKFLTNLGPNCDDAKVKATSVMENTVPAAPIIAPEMVVKILRAESGLFTKNIRAKPSLGMVTIPSRYTNPIDIKIEIMRMSTGINQNVILSSFQ